MNSSYILTANTLTVMHNGQVQTCSASHRLWDGIKTALKNDDFDTALDMMKPVNAIRSFSAGAKGIEVTDSAVLYNGEPLAGPLVDRIFSLREEGFTIEPLVKFCENLMQNPSYRSREQLYTFLEHNNMPITPDGCFMAYKRVNDDFTDVHSGTLVNFPGAVLEMSRFNVDDDPNRTCSAGLHVCSREYLKAFQGSRLVACKVNPADVVAVPTDYNFTKMRVCKYEVVEELPLSLVTDLEPHWNAAVYDTSPEEDDDDDDDDCMNHDGDWEDPDHYDYDD
jgi:hypothetical protein